MGSSDRTRPVRGNEQTGDDAAADTSGCADEDMPGPATEVTLAGLRCLQSAPRSPLTHPQRLGTGESTGTLGPEEGAHPDPGPSSRPLRSILSATDSAPRCPATLLAPPALSGPRPLSSVSSPSPVRLTVFAGQSIPVPHPL